MNLNVTCRYAGVFHVEKNGRYSISRTEAADLCQAFNSTLPTMAQMKVALSKGFETCRYGFIEGNVVIPRIHPNAICAANHTGVYVLLTSNTSHYDTYCFNASAPLEEDCTSVTDLPNSFEGPVTITIVNRDGTRYSKKGEYRTHQEDIDSSNNIEDDVSSGSAIEKSTSEGYILHTSLPTAQPTRDQDDTFMRSTLATSTESNTNPTGWEPNEENEDETDKYPSFSGSGIDDDEDFISSTKPNQDRTQMPDIDRNSTSTHGENRIQEPQPPFNNHEYQDEEETPHATSTSKKDDALKFWYPSYQRCGLAAGYIFGACMAPHSTAEEAATQQEKWFENGWQGKETPTPSEDSHVTEGTTEWNINIACLYDINDPRVISQHKEYGNNINLIPLDTDSSHSTTIQPTAAPNTHLVEDLDRTGSLSVTTPQSHSQNFSTLQGELEEDEDHTTTSILPSSTKSGGKDGRRGGSLPRDTTTSLEGYTPHYPDTMENRTLFPVTPAQTEVFGETEVTVATDSNFNVDGSLPEESQSVFFEHKYFCVLNIKH
ncbi:CD44 antigen [Apodemus speciosus]|uniref:CD44 antigen n=1 Tax=Apodemus speciosus TaxID=105296 RepID=A0ABQ0EIF2_APOSI